MVEAYKYLKSVVNEDVEIKAGEPIPKTEPNSKFNPETVRDIVANPEVVTADSVRAWTPHFEKPKKKNFDKLVDVAKGYESTVPVKAVSQNVFKNRPKSIYQQLLKEAGGAPVGPEAQVDKDYEGTSAMEKVAEALGSPTAKNIFAALAIDEHLMVALTEKALNQFAGAQYREKEHIGDYTWGNFLKESGMPDNGYTTSLGLGMSIFLSPSTYLTFGTSKTRLLADIPKELGGLSVTKHGARVLNTIAKSEGDTVVAKELAKLNKKLLKQGEKAVDKLPVHEENIIRRKALTKTHKEFVKQFGPTSALIGKIKSSETLKAKIKDLGDEKVLDDIIEFGGIKWESPKTIFGLVDNPMAGGKQFKILADSPLRGGDVYMFGKKVMHGEEVAHTLNRLGLPKTMEWLGKSPIGKGAKATKDYLGEHLIVNYGVPKQLVKAFRTVGDDSSLVKLANKQYGKEAVDNARFLAVVEDAIDMGEGIKAAAFRRADEFFKGLSKEERKEFSEVMIEASTKDKKILVKTPSGNPKVQDLIDKWHGQGKYAEGGVVFKARAGAPIVHPKLDMSKEVQENMPELIKAVRKDRIPRGKTNFNFIKGAESGENFSKLLKSSKIIDDTATELPPSLAKNCGKCFDVASQHFMKNGGTLKHGVVKLHGKGQGTYHAWVQHGDKVFEPQTGKIYTESVFKKLFAPAEDFSTKTTKELKQFGKGPFTDKGIQEIIEAGVRPSQNIIIRKQKQMSIAQELAEKSKMIDGDPKALANWYPGIMHYIGLDDVKFNRVLGDTERKFLTERMGKEFVEGYTRNPVQAFSVRLAQIGYADLQEQVFKRIKDLNIGRDIDVAKLSTKELTKRGYRAIHPPQWSLIKKLGEAGDDVVPNGTAHYVKADFAEHYNKITRGQAIPKFLQPFNYVTNLWKGTVTRAFPAFHARNFQSNIVMNAMRIGGHALSIPKNIKALQVITREVNPFRAMRVSKEIDIGKLWFSSFKVKNPNFVATPANKFLQFAENAYDVVTGINKNKEWISEIGERMSAKSLLDEASELGLHRAGQFVEDIGGTHLSVPGQNFWSHALNRTLNPMSKDFVFNAVGGKFGRLIEDQARMVNYITWRQRGLSPKMALKEVNEALFDYGAITNFEKSARVFIPFYTFNRKNIANYMKVLAHRPGAVTSQLKFLRDIGPNVDEMREQFPEWANRKFGVKMSEYLVTGYGIPMEDIIELANDPKQQSILRSAPWLRYGLEKVYQKDTFTNRELQAVNNANEFKLALDIYNNESLPEGVRAIVSPVVNWLELKRDPSNRKKIIGNPDRLHMLRSGFTSRWQSIVGQATKEDQEGWITAVRFLTGHIVLKPDAKLKRSIERSISVKEIKEGMLKNNLARPLGVFAVGGTKTDRDFVNYWMKKALDGGSVKRQRMIREKFKEGAEKRKERNIGR